MKRQTLYVQSLGESGEFWIGSVPPAERIGFVKRTVHGIAGPWPAWAEYVSIAVVFALIAVVQ